MRLAAACFVLAAAAIAGAWAWLGAPIAMPETPLGPGEKAQCISYAPFRADQNPFGPDVPIDPGQIEEDLVRLKPLTDCIRTYSVDHGLDQIAEIAGRHDMKVLQGLWLTGMPDFNRKQIATAVALAKRYPDVIQAVIVGNEVLLRGEMSAPELANTIRAVKAQVSMPVTYADVWEFWLRYREVAAAVDFVTIHILPYWEDVPIPVDQAARHVDSIRNQLVAAFPNKEVLVGEFGWPSAGRMREGALPSPANQARLIQQVMAQARRENYRVNIIEAFDQPWKRQLEGTVGGHWGLLDAWHRQAKFAWGAPVSNHPDWRVQAGGGIALALLVFAAALGSSRRTGKPPAAGTWSAIAAVAAVSGTLIGWTIANVPIESLVIGDWVRSCAWVLVAAATPVVGAAALATGASAPSFAGMLGRRGQRPRDPLALLLGALLIAVAVLTLQAAFGLVFDPRYRDFPFAPLTGAVAPLVAAAFLGTTAKGPYPTAELVAAAALIVSAVYIVLNETVVNWQAMWFCAGVVALAVTLLRARDAPG